MKESDFKNLLLGFREMLEGYSKIAGDGAAFTLEFKVTAAEEALEQWIASKQGQRESDVEKRGRVDKASGRKQASRLVEMKNCEGVLESGRACRSKKGLERHHKDRDPTNNDPSNIEVLCQNCHKEDHLKDGTWGNPASVKPDIKYLELVIKLTDEIKGSLRIA